MSSSEKFWLSAWAIGGGTLCALTFMGLLYWQSVNKLIVEGIKAGVHPIAMKCALDDDTHDGAICSQALPGR